MPCGLWQPRVVPFPFSDRTVGHLAEAISEGHSHTTMDALFMKSGAHPWFHGGANKLDKSLGVLRELRDDGSTDAFDAALEIARLMLISGKAAGFRDPPTWWQPLRDAIAADGWEFDEATDDFLPLVPGASMAVEADWITTELTRRGWTVAAGHYRQGIENFADGRWAAANGQLRAFFESTVRAAGGTDKAPGSGQVQKAFDNLDTAQAILQGESEFGKKLWVMLHPGGSHPGLSSEDESRFRLLALTGYIRFLLRRLPG